MNQPQTDRRAVLRTAAWAAPATLVATASPAFAASQNTLTVSQGSSDIRAAWGPFTGVYFQNLTISPRRFLPGNKGIQVTLTATSPARLHYLFGERTDDPDPWTMSSTAGSQNSSLTLTYALDVHARENVRLNGVIALLMTTDQNPVNNARVTISVTTPDASPSSFTLVG